MNDFQIQSLVPNIRPSYKKLADVKTLGIKDYSTIEGLAEEFLISRLKVSAILKEAKIWPVGRIFEVDANTQKQKQGQPRLAYDTNSAKDKIIEVLKGKL